MVWSGAKERRGYGSLSRAKTTKDGKLLPERAHRFSWIIHNGEIPSGKWILHKCDNPSCVNPEHLFIGDRQNNIKDMMNKNRQYRPIGSKNSQATIERESAIKIRTLYVAGEYPYPRLMRMFGLSKSQISRIVRGQSWV